MPQKFITQLEQACRRRRKHQWFTATCWAIAAILVAALVLMGLDRTLGVNDTLGRGLLTMAFVVLTAIILHRWFVAGTENAASPLPIAQEIEDQNPTLRDVVANAWEFSQESDADPTAGSKSLRRAVVLRAASETDAIAWQQLTPLQPLQQAAIALACVCLTIGLLNWQFPTSLQAGLARLANPRSTAEWPRKHDLQFVNPPALLASGEDLALQLHDSHGSLPKSITMHYRTKHQGRWQEETRLQKVTTDPLAIRRPTVQKSLEYRATGADHQTMPWHSLKVVAAPRIEKLEITVHPPVYTELPSYNWDQNASFYAGSDLEMQGETDQPITQVELISSKGTQEIAQLDPNKKSFRFARTNWKPGNCETFSLKLTTAIGLTTIAKKWTIEIVADRSPQIRFIEPAADLVLVPTAPLPLVLKASDELGVKAIELLFRRSDQLEEGEQTLASWEYADQKLAPEQQVEFLWELSPQSLKPGISIELDARATDAQPATGQTVRPLQIKIVSEDQLWHQLIERQARLVETLTQLLHKQRQLLVTTTEWANYPKETETPSANNCHAVLFRQRQITNSLTERHHGIISQIHSLLNTIESNRLLRPEATEHLLATQGVLQNLVDDPLPATEFSLRRITRKSHRSADRKTLATWVTATSKHQEQVVAGLRRAIELLMPANVVGRIEKKLAALEADQHILAEHCRTEIAPEILQTENLTPRQKATLTSAAQRQRRLAHRLAKLLLNITRSADRLSTTDPSLASRLAETLTLARELNIQTAIQAAADQLDRQLLGRSATLQRQALANLKSLRKRLTGQDDLAMAERLQSLQAVERRLQALRQQIAALEHTLQEIPDDQQEKLAEESEKVSDQLKHLQIPQAAAAASKAASQLRTPGNKNTKQARQQLEIAQQAVTNARRRQQVALARLQMARLHSKLIAFIARQQSIEQKILPMENLTILSKLQQQSVSKLTVQQAELRREVSAEAEQLTSLPVFAHLLKQASERMQGVESRLEQEELSQPTAALAKQATSALTQLAEALQQDRKKLAGNIRNQSGNRAGQQQAGDKPQEQTLQLALGQLQLLKTLQEQLHNKTQALESQSAGDLARQQKQLANLAQQLLLDPTEP